MSSLCKPSIDVANELKKGVAFHQSGNLTQAEEFYQKILAQNSRHPDALQLLGVIAFQRENHDEAERLMSRAVQIEPENPIFLNTLGTVYNAKGKHTKALGCYKKAIQFNSDNLEALCNLAQTFHMLKEVKAAVDCYQKSILLNPNHFEAHFNLGILLHEQGFLEDAICSYQKAIDLKPDFAKTYYYAGIAFQDRGAMEKAIFYYRKVIALQPQFFEAYNGMGTAWQGLNKFEKALACYQKALDLVPDFHVAYVNMGNVFQAQGKPNKAVTYYRKAIEIEPQNAVTHLNMGISLMDSGKSAEAKSSYRRALEINPEYAKACAYLVSRLQQECSWQELRRWDKKLDVLTRRSLDKGVTPAETPFLNITRHADPELNFKVARLWCRNFNRQTSSRPWNFDFGDRLSKGGRITVGYLSNNYRNHPTAHLMVDLFGVHNRARFNVACYSYGKNDGSSYRALIQHNCDRFVELNKLDNVQAAAKIFEDKVDILVDLAGHTEGNRMEICALRPAPVQVRYLGMPGTTGADCFDYIITDSVVTPKAHAPCYSEKFVYLPGCYQINSDRKSLAGLSFSREELGLPERDFVFCSFNTNYKLDPIIFDIWMRIMGRVRGSVLWLLKGSEAVVRNLRKEADSRGIDPDRMVFAPKVPKEEHLARLQVADLALDTWVVNGAITTSDALWAGIPVLAVEGSHFASRMSSSILAAVGLADLVAPSFEEYEALAVHLAENPLELKKVKEKLKINQKTKPLFNTAHFVSQLERAYEIMSDIYRAGDEPRQIEAKEI